MADADPLSRRQDLPYIDSLVVRCAQGDSGLEVEALIFEERPHHPRPVTAKTAPPRPAKAPAVIVGPADAERWHEECGAPIMEHTELEVWLAD